MKIRLRFYRTLKHFWKPGVLLNAVENRWHRGLPLDRSQPARTQVPETARVVSSPEPQEHREWFEWLLMDSPEGSTPQVHLLHTVGI